MTRSPVAVIAALTLIVTACTGGGSTAGEEPVGAGTEITTPATTDTPASTLEPTTTTAAEAATTETTTDSSSTGPAVPLLSDVLETSAGWPTPVTLWDKTGARKQGHLAGEPEITIVGPLATLAEVPLQGWVYQREQQSNIIYFSDGVSPERELLVGTGEQSLILEGVWLRDGDSDRAEVIYQRFDPDGQNSTQTLRGYSMATGDVRELTITGGFESATSFALVNERFAAARFYGEGHYELSLIDLDTGDRPYASSNEFDCFDGGEPACPEYDQAVAIGTDIFGFGSVSDSVGGVVDRMGVYRFDTTTSTEELLASYPWDNGAYYAVDMVHLNNEIAISLATDPFIHGLGEPLPAILFDIGTGQSTLAPESGFVQPSWLS